MPNDNTGDIMGDVTKRRGRVLGMEPDEDGLQTIIAEVPLAELANFTTFIRQTTQGRGWFTTEFARYEILPEMLVPAVVEQAKKLGKQLGQLEAAGFAGAAFMDKDEVKLFAQQ